ncbi:MAG: DUF883 domain-containing protein [Ottowia sp.]|jgi:ElaB/YqjD/DUF883 family membrane-anchored ribosome-binding protein|uniref:DUF883 family protein n=1 Tax=Ottowia sp. TaxID=1898956 RepID=UPI001B6907B6|nr:DUF883 family protein [Ottowia sp.]MBP6665646.1 DUF883 domain-containing protein [Ottowia sp.]MBP7454679.1 DUF883 domain-containing protein [Ottowia sp.]MBP7457086.1 DUF883 domain-containing protein [Ottowia sp.]MBP8161550.1 DUF883 domain-containing protein [Ottowia sp.]MBP8860350.1 DUF883 domain-containing protein [Ottowia sp.]
MSYTSDLVDSATETKDQLVSNLRRVVSDAEDLLAATAGQTDSKITELRARAKENLSMAREKLADADAVVRARARQAAAVTDEYVHDNPWSSIGAAAALGILIGVLLGRR